jgi:hypothetical protein
VLAALKTSLKVARAYSASAFLRQSRQASVNKPVASTLFSADLTSTVLLVIGSFPASAKHWYFFTPCWKRASFKGSWRLPLAIKLALVGFELIWGDHTVVEAQILKETSAGGGGKPNYFIIEFVDVHAVDCDKNLALEEPFDVGNSLKINSGCIEISVCLGDLSGHGGGWVFWSHGRVEWRIKTTSVKARYSAGVIMMARYPWQLPPQAEGMDMALLLISFSKVVMVS